MAEFDFKKFLKEGVEEKKLFRPVLTEILSQYGTEADIEPAGPWACPVPMGSPDGWGCYVRDMKADPSGMKCRWAKGCRNERCEGVATGCGEHPKYWQTATTNNLQYLPSGVKAEREKRMRKSTDHAVDEIIDTVLGKWVPAAEMARIILGLKYWKNLGRLDEIEMKFKQRWGIDPEGRWSEKRSKHKWYPFFKKTLGGIGRGDIAAHSPRTHRVPDRDGKEKCIK